MGIAELLIIGVVLILIIATLVGLVLLVVFLSRRREAARVTPERRVTPEDPSGPARER